MRLLWMTLVLALPLTGCPAEDAASPKSGAVKLADQDILVQTDFEAEAEQAVTDDNYEAQLEAIEGEINAAKAPSP